MRRVAAAVGLDVVGSAVVLILLSLTWQQVRIDRQPPFADVAVGLSGRTVAPAAFGLALVTLAGAVAALATRGVARRVVGVLVTAAGVGTAVAALLATGAPSDAHARTLAAEAVADRTSATAVVPIDDGTVAVVAHALWPVLTAVAAVLAVVAGVLFVLPDRSRGRATTAGGLGPRYEAPVAAERPRDTTLWSALDHGEDPTVDEADPPPNGHEHGSDAASGRFAPPPTTSM
ncbi:Trp biosynthesis-associated membrane protein [Jatrophihabitans sp. YIM 134969]